MPNWNIQNIVSSLMLRANGQGGSSATVLAAHFAKRNTKFGGGGKARAGKNSFPPTPFLFARLRQRRTGDLKVFQNSAFGFSLKKVRISFSVRSKLFKASKALNNLLPLYDEIRTFFQQNSDVE